VWCQDTSTVPLLGVVPRHKYHTSSWCGAQTQVPYLFLVWCQDTRTIPLLGVVPRHKYHLHTTTYSDILRHTQEQLHDQAF